MSNSRLHTRTPHPTLPCSYVAPDWQKLPPMTTCPSGYRHATASEELYIASPLLRTFFLDSQVGQGGWSVG